MAEITTKHKPTLCLDFDGVLHSYTSGWQGAAVVSDPPVAGAVEFLLRAAEHFTLCVHSSRSHQPEGVPAMAQAIASWVSREVRGVSSTAFDGEKLVVRRVEHEDVVIHFPRHKPPATVSIDDRAVTFTGEWPDPEVLLAFKPWNKK